MESTSVLAVHRTAQATAAIVLAVGLVVLVVGWWGGVDALAQVIPGTAPMKANTALGFILAGTSLLGLLNGRAVVAIGAAAVLVLLGGGTVLEYAAGVDLGIDQLLVEDRILDATASPGRPGLNTASAFTAIGVALLLGRGSAWWHGTAQLFAAVTAALALMALQAYLFEAEQPGGIASATQMAPHTAIAMLLTATSFLSAHADRGVLSLLHSKHNAGATLRRLLPATALGVVAVAVVVVSLGRAEVVTDPNLQLAVLSTLVLIVLVGAILLVGWQLEVAERERRAAELDLSSLVLAFPDLHVRVGPDRNIRAVYGRLRDVTGLHPRVGDRADEVLPAEVVRLLEQMGGQTADQSRAISIEQPDSGLTLQARLARTEGGDVGVSVRDITPLAEAQRALEQLNEELEERVARRTLALQRSNEELARFAYVASHDLQEPLRMVSAFVSRLRDKYGDQLDEKGQQYVRFAVEGAERMSALIEALLEYSRAGRDEVEAVPVDLERVVDQVVASLRGSLERSSGRLERGRLPTVLGDEVLLRQVLQNLISNALKFVAEDRTPEVSVSATVDGGYATIAVADNGIGIPDEFKDGVFGVFRRLHSRTDYPGTGIGLSIVQRLVQRLGGEIWIEDSPGGRGTTFRFTMPVPKDESQ